jgi:hypothetical protein
MTIMTKTIDECVNEEIFDQVAYNLQIELGDLYTKLICKRFNNENLKICFTHKEMMKINKVIKTQIKTYQYQLNNDRECN